MYFIRFDECTEISLVLNQLIVPSCFKHVHVVSKYFTLYKRTVLYSAKYEEIYGIVSYQKFSDHATLLYKKIKMWVTSGSYVGHIWIVLWVSGSNGLTGVTHFQVSTLLPYTVDFSIWKLNSYESMYIDHQFNTETHNMIYSIYMFTLSVYDKSKS